MSYSLGIDIGSTTVKYVLCDPDFTIVAKAYTPHDTKQAPTLLRLLKTLSQTHKEIYDKIDKVYITGSGASRIAPTLNARFVQEVNAVVLAVEHLHPDVRSVVELGGQDAKIIHFKEGKDGKKTVLTSMNDKCASGTGATIEKCTMKVGMEQGEVQKLSFQTDKLHHVAAKCGVFAETDIVNLVKTSVPSNEIMNSLADAIVMQNLTVLTRGNTLMPKVLLLGGPNTYLPFLQQFECIFYGVSLAELVDLEKEFSCFIDQYCFGRGGASVYAQETGGFLSQFGRRECFDGIFFFKCCKLFRTLYERCVNIVIFVDTPCVNQCFQRDESGKRFLVVGFAFTEDHRTKCCIILGILRQDDQFVKFCFVIFDTPFIPKLCNTHTPALL